MSRREEGRVSIPGSWVRFGKRYRGEGWKGFRSVRGEDEAHIVVAMPREMGFRSKRDRGSAGVAQAVLENFSRRRGRKGCSTRNHMAKRRMVILKPACS